MRTAITLFFLVSLLCSSLSAATLTQAQKDQLKTLLPGVTLSDSTIEKLEDVFYTRDMPVRSRLKAISQMVGLDQMPAGSTLKRTICIWDIGGRNGPVFNAAMGRGIRHQPGHGALYQRNRDGGGVQGWAL